MENKGGGGIVNAKAIVQLQVLWRWASNRPRY